MSVTASSVRSFTVAGFPLRAWGLALRIWVAMILALYVGFWLQLDSAASAAITVGILALPTRGQAYQKAVFRFGATVVGIVASLVIASLFAQARDLFVLAFALWLALCVYVSGLLDGNRAYGAVLSGYTAAIVAVQQIDTPQNIFSAGVERGAAIALGIAAIALVSDLFAAPDAHVGLLQTLRGLHRRVRDLAARALRGEGTDTIESATLLRQVTALHPDMTVLASESNEGRARGRAARSAGVAMLATIEAASALAALPLPADEPMRAEAEVTLVAGVEGEDDASVPEMPQARQALATADEHRRAAFARQALDLVDNDRWTIAAMQALAEGRDLGHIAPTPLYRSKRLALRHALRAFLCVAIAGLLFAVTGWTSTSTTLSLVGVLVALSATNPNPRGFAKGALVAMPLAAATAGITTFFVLDGVDAFPLLAIAMAPTVIAAALMSQAANPLWKGVGTLLLIFFVVILAPANPQSYNPQTYLVTSALAILAVVVFFALLEVVLPTTDEDKRKWLLDAARADMLALCAGWGRATGPEALFREADRVGQLAALAAGEHDGGRSDLREALSLFDRAGSARRLRAALDNLDGTGVGAVAEARDALAAINPSGLRHAATVLRQAARDLGATAATGWRSAAAQADLAATLLERDGRR